MPQSPKIQPQPEAQKPKAELQFAYHREAAFRAPWTGTDAYGYMRQYNQTRMTPEARAYRGKGRA